MAGPIAVRTRDAIGQTALEHEIGIVGGKVAKDRAHLLIAYRPVQNTSKIVQWPKGIGSRILPSEFARLRKIFRGRHFGTRGYLAVGSGNIADETIREYIEEREGENIADASRFSIDPKRTPRLIVEGVFSYKSLQFRD